MTTRVDAWWAQLVSGRFGRSLAILAWRSLVLGVLGTAWGSLAHAAIPATLRFAAPVVGPLAPDTPVRIPLPAQVMSAAASGLSDLRLFDEHGGETPYGISPHRTLPASAFVFRIVAYQPLDGGASLVLQRPQEAGPFWELTLHTSARDFHKTVQFQVSQDAQVWTDALTDTLFDFSSQIDVRRTTLSFPETDAPYVRLLLRDVALAAASPPRVRLRFEEFELAVPGASALPFHIDRITGRSGRREQDADSAGYTPVPLPATRTDAQGNTVVLLGRVNLPVTRLTLTIDRAYYHRHVELWAATLDQEDAYTLVASGVIYRLPGVAASTQSLDVDAVQRPYLRLKIRNGDNPPVPLRQVDLTWIRSSLYFVPAAGQRYTLYFGGEGLRSPAYELQQLLPALHASRVPYPMAQLGEVRASPHYQPHLAQDRREWWEKTLLTVVVVLLAGGLGIWAYRLCRVVTRNRPGASR